MNNYFSRLYDTLTGKKVPSTVSIDSEISYANINGLLFGDGRGGSGKIPITIYNPGKLITSKGYAVIDNMRRDSQIKVALNFKKHAILSTGWAIDSPEGAEEDWEVSIFVEKNLYNMPGTFDRSLRNILSSMDYGFSVTEPVWTRLNDGKIGYKVMKTRKPHDFEFKIDAHGNIISLLQNSIEMPLERFIVVSHVDEFGNPYGQSDLEAAYVPWWLKDNAYKFLAIMLERLGIPPVFASYNAKAFTRASDQTALQKIIDKMQSGMAATIPRGDSKDDITFWAPEIAGQASTVFIPALQHADQDIAKSILLPSLVGGTTDNTTGSLARSKTHFDTFMMVVEGLRNEITDMVNEQIIKPLVDLNYSVEAYPTFRFNPLESRDIQNLLGTWKDLVDKKIVSKQQEDEKFIREQLEFPPISDEEAAVSIITSTEPINPKEVDNEPTNATFATTKTAILSRQPNSYDAKVDFAQASSVFDEISKHGIEELGKAYKDTRDILLGSVRRNYEAMGPSMVDKLELKRTGPIQDVFAQLVRKAFEAGDYAARQEVAARNKNYKLRPISGFTPREAQDYLKQKALKASATSNEKLLSAVKDSLLTALRGQKTAGEVTAEITTIFETVIGDKPSYAEVVVRTNLIDAYNQGRLTAIRDPELELFVQGVEYSAILDERTTELCSSLDGKVFKTTDPDLDRLTPPNHFNCRSILVPVLITEPSPSYIDSRTKAEAVDMAGKFA